MRLITRRRVVQAEFFVLQQVAVVRQEGDAAHNFIVVVEDNFSNSYELEFDLSLIHISMLLPHSPSK